MKDKVKVLDDILQEYCKYFRYFSKVKVYNLGLRFYVKFYESKSPDYFGTFYSRKIPINDIDKWIANYRAKVHNEKQKIKCLSEQKPEPTKMKKAKDLLTSFFASMTLKESNQKNTAKKTTP